MTNFKTKGWIPQDGELRMTSSHPYTLKYLRRQISLVVQFHLRYLDIWVDASRHIRLWITVTAIKLNSMFSLTMIVWEDPHYLTCFCMMIQKGTWCRISCSSSVMLSYLSQISDSLWPLSWHHRPKFRLASRTLHLDKDKQLALEYRSAINHQEWASISYIQEFMP